MPPSPYLRGCHGRDLRGRLIRSLGCLLLLAAGAAGMRAQTLPAIPPTSSANQTSLGAAQSVPAPPPPPQYAEVTYANGQLRVQADNSSLNQILRSISHQTGLKITGGVADQRVFGTYGPASISTILATLLDGTGTNILLLGGNAKTPPELILTQRNGGPDPPGPDSPTYAMYDRSNRQPAASHSVSASHSVPASHGAPNGPGARAVTTTAANVAASGKALTPEMVMQELLRMQAQRNQKSIQPVQKQNSSSQPHPQ